MFTLGDKDFLKCYYQISDIDISFDKESGTFSICGKAEKDGVMFSLLELYNYQKNREKEKHLEDTKSPEDRITDKLLKEYFNGYKRIFRDNTIWDLDSLEESAPYFLSKENPSNLHCFLLYLYMCIVMRKITNIEPFIKQIAIDSGFENAIVYKTDKFDTFNYLIILDCGNKECDVVKLKI